MNSGSTSCKRSSEVACRTYCTGMLLRRPPKVLCCWTKARARVFVRTAAEISSAISICERLRVAMSESEMRTFPEPLDTRAMTDSASGTSESTSRLISSV